MITFQEFTHNIDVILERYYEPDEKLPSGKTPVQKAEERQKRPFKTRYPNIQRVRHKIELEKNVRHGADNPNINTHSHPELNIRANNRRGDDYDFYHHPSAIKYHVRRLSSQDEHGRDTYSIAWNHSHRGARMSDKTARHITRNALKVWDNHIEHRLPHNTVITNSPTPNYKLNKKSGDYVESNTRAKLYQRKGFGRLKAGDQYAEVGRNPSPKQRAKGKKRLKPLD